MIRISPDLADALQADDVVRRAREQAECDVMAERLDRDMRGRPSVPRLWPGSTIVILGGGPSLTAEDVQYVQRGHMHAMINGPGEAEIRVIAIKEAYLLAPWADVLYAADDTWWQYYDGAPTFKGFKYAIYDERGSTWPRTYPDVQILENTGNHGLEVKRTGLRTGYNSGYQAINLAVHLGASRIVLLGFDCWAGRDGQQNWHVTKRPHRDSPYPVFMQAFSTLAEPLAALDIEVLNCSRQTLLRCFPRQPLEEVLP